MLSEVEILSTLDDTYKFGYYWFFIPLGHPYTHLIDCRLNIFRREQDKWAVAAEILGYNPRGGVIELQIYYYGNCLTNLEEYNNQLTNNYSVFPIEENGFFESIEEPNLSANAEFWLVRGSKVVLSVQKQDYINNGIELKEYEPNEIGIEEAARLAIITDKDLFRATDDELYKSIPKDLKKILVLDEWYHKDFNMIDSPSISEDHLKSIFESNKELNGMSGIDFATFEKLVITQDARNNDHNQNQWDEARPGSYETWQLLAKVIATGDASFYKPTLAPNTHWINWPESGSL